MTLFALPTPPCMSLEEAFHEFSEESLMLAEEAFQACAEVVIEEPA